MRDKGFTLVELLAVIAIIAIIAVSAITGVNSVINKQRIKLATVAEEHIKEAALTYFSNKKGTYIEPCVDIDDDYSTIPQYSIKEANDKFRNSLNSSGITSEEARFAKAKEYTASINNNENIKNQFNEEYLDLKNIGCFKVVTVGELIEKGLMEDNKNMCNKASIIVVYQQGSAKNKAGIATSIQEPQICNGQKIKKQLPVITVNPDSDSTPTPKKTINVAIYDENKKLKKPVSLEYAWSTDRNREPTSGWKTLNIDTNKKKGNKNITVKGLSGVNYLWIRSKGTIDSYNNEIMAFPSGPYHFLSVMQLSYNDNGGKDCSSKKKEIVETYLYGQDIDKNNAPLCEPKRTGYEFKGWDFSGRQIQNNTVVTETTNHTVKANWDAITVTINLNKNNATNTATDKLTIKYGTNTFNPSTITVPERVYTISFNANSMGATISSLNSKESRYNFDGWNTTASGGKKVINNAATPVLQANVSGYTDENGKWAKTTTTTLYAKWSGGSVSLPTITKTGHTCGWATSSTGNIAYNSGASLTPTENLELFGKCNPDYYTVTLNNNGATTPGSATTKVTYLGTKLNSITNPKKEYKVSFNLGTTEASATTTALKATYTLNGWYTEASGGSKVASNAETPELQANISGLTNASKQWIKTDSVILYAQWSSASVTLPTISKTGSTCNWNTKSDGTGTSYNGGATYTPTANTTLYARCNVQSYTINLNSNGATTDGSTSTTVKYLGTTLGAITNPKKEYTVDFNKGSTNADADTNQLKATYTLNGWYTAASGGSKVATSAETPALQANVTDLTNASKQWNKTGGATLYAQWSSASVKLPSISKASYLCTWNTKSDGSGTAHAGGDSFTPTSNTILYAVCKPSIVAITLNNQSANSAGTTKIYEKYEAGWYKNSNGTTSITSITKPSKDGYTFKGYYTETDGKGKQVINASGSIVAANNLFISDTTVYAYWEPHVLYIKYFGGADTFDVVDIKTKWCGNAASNYGLNNSKYVYIKDSSNYVKSGDSTIIQKVEYGSNVVLLGREDKNKICMNRTWQTTGPRPVENPLPVNTKLAVWKVGSATYNDGATVSAATLASAGGCNLKTSASCTVTLNVNWRKTTLMVKYYCNGGTVAAGDFIRNKDNGNTPCLSDYGYRVDYDSKAAASTGVRNHGGQATLPMCKSGYNADGNRKYCVANSTCSVIFNEEWTFERIFQFAARLDEVTKNTSYKTNYYNDLQHQDIEVELWAQYDKCSGSGQCDSRDICKWVFKN